jgi:hypothetical protein
MLETLKKYKEMMAIGISAAICAFFMYSTYALAESHERKISSVEKAIVLLTASVQNDSGKLEGFLIAMGIDPTKAQTWSRYPKEPQTDSSGVIVPNVPWAQITESLDVGVQYVVTLDSLSKPNLLVDTLWDFRKKTN